MTPSEFNALIESTRRGEPFRGLSGLDGERLYLLAAYTGFREGQLVSLAAASFDFESDPATVSVEAGHSKRRRRDIRPLRGDLARIVLGVGSRARQNRTSAILRHCGPVRVQT